MMFNNSKLSAVMCEVMVMMIQIQAVVMVVYLHIPVLQQNHSARIRILRKSQQQLRGSKRRIN